jgi:branched-chain amino acid transport system permease protein
MLSLSKHPLLGIAVAIAIVVAAPLVVSNGFMLFLIEQAFIMIAAALSLNLLVGYCGLISLGHSALFALGAYVLAISEVKFGLPFVVGLIAAGILGGVVGFILGFPSLRLGRYTIAMVTLGYALVAVKLPLAFPDLTGGGGGLHGIVGPIVGGVPLSGVGYAWCLGAFTVLTYVVLRNIIHSPYGRAMIAGEDSAPGAASLGVSISGSKLTAFVISSSFAALAGALFVVVLRTIDQGTFGLDYSVQLILMVLLGGAGTLIGPVYGTLILLAIPFLIDRLGGAPGSVTLLIYSVIVMLVVVFAPHGVVGLVDAARRKLGPRAPEIDERLEAPVPSGQFAEIAPFNGPLLDVRDLSHVIGGLRAVDGVSLAVEAGTIHGLIGPNGAGKTTFVNCLTGFARPTGGTIEVGGRAADVRDPARGPAVGIVRTFQHPETFNRLTCLENILVALDRRTRRSIFAYMLRLPSAVRTERATRASALAFLRTVGLGKYVDVRGAQLPPGLRQILSLARSIAAGPKVLLLDEPAGGLTGEELPVLEATLQAARSHGLGILLIDHNADFVLRICDTITVVDYGKVIAVGRPEAIRNDPKVIAAYLGTAAVEAAP